MSPVGKGRALEPPRAVKRHDRWPNRGIAKLAGRQHGVVARCHLLELGLSRHEIGHRLAGGSLIPVHRGVHAVGHRRLSREGRWMAALLAIGPDGVLSHRSAAALWGIRTTARERVDVTVPRALRSQSGIELHRSGLPADETTVRGGIPVTTPPRTLLDLAAVIPRHQLERAVNEAEVQRLTDELTLDELLNRHPAGREAESFAH